MDREERIEYIKEWILHASTNRQKRKFLNMLIEETSDEKLKKIQMFHMEFLDYKLKNYTPEQIVSLVQNDKSDFDFLEDDYFKIATESGDAYLLSLNEDEYTEQIINNAEYIAEIANSVYNSNPKAFPRALFEIIKFNSDDIQKVIRLAEMIEENAFVMLKKHIEKSDYDMEDTKTFGLIKEIQDKAYNILCVLEER